MNAPAQPPAVSTTCSYCGVGCGVLGKPDGRGGAVIAGDPAPRRAVGQADGRSHRPRPDDLCPLRRGLNVIRETIAGGAAVSIEDIGTALRAGTNCGSCLPELKRIVHHDRVAQTA